MTKALFAGTFDPITKGHLDIIERSCAIFEHVYVVCMINHEKETMFGLQERMQLLKQSLRPFANAVLDSYEGMSVQYAEEHGIHTLIRGIRSFADYEYEWNIAAVNRELSGLETLFLPADPTCSFISSSTVKAVAVQHGDLSKFAEPHVVEALQRHYRYGE